MHKISMFARGKRKDYSWLEYFRKTVLSEIKCGGVATSHVKLASGRKTHLNEAC